MKYLFIYPNKEQRETICVRLRKSDYKIISNYLEFVDDIKSYKILCCNEEALYYLKKYDKKFLQDSVLFRKECLNFYLKYNAYLSFKKNNINVVKKSRCYFGSCIAKPDFGFASLGVKKIVSDDELKSYFDDLDNAFCKNLKSMYEKYFDNFTNDVVYEEVIENNIFFSVPFIYYNKQIYSFPIEGIKTLKNSSTDFYWTEFLLNLNTINKEIKSKIDDLLEQLALLYINGNSVNMAEVMYNKKDKKIYLIEFSPRVPDGKLSKMIEYATGLNLNKISIDLFLNNDVDLTLVKKESVKLIIDLNMNDNYSNDCFEKISEFSSLFNSYVNYYFLLNVPTVGLVPGRFAPLHKGHEFLINYALQKADKVIVVIFDTSDTCVPLEIRANWIKTLFPTVEVIQAKNCPDGHKYAYENGVECEIIQNEFIEKKLNNNRVDYVFHSTQYGDCVSSFLGAQSINVDFDRNMVPISGTMIRNDLNSYREFLSDYIFDEYSNFLIKNNENK